MPGTSQRATTATAATVSPTATSARPVTARQFCLRSRGEESKAASSSTGATSSVSASSGSSVTVGAFGQQRQRRAGQRQQRRVGRVDPPRHGGQDRADQQQRDDELEEGHGRPRAESSQSYHGSGSGPGAPSAPSGPVLRLSTSSLHRALQPLRTCQEADSRKLDDSGLARSQKSKPPNRLGSCFPICNAGWQAACRPPRRMSARLREPCVQATRL